MPRTPSQASPGSAWIPRLALLLWLAFLAYPPLLRGDAGPPAGPTLRDAAGVDGALALARAWALAAAVEIARFLPLGALAVLSLPRRPTRLERLALVAIPALLLALVLAAVVRSLELGPPRRVPGPLSLALPAVGCAIGVWAGLAWMKGWGARLWFFPKLAVVIGLLLFGLGAFLYQTVDPAPLPFEPPRVTSAEKRRLTDVFKSRNPAKIPEGQTRTLRLAERDVDLLLAWGLPLGRGGAKAKVELRPQEATLLLSAGLPTWGGRYWNIVAGGPVAFEDGRLRVVPSHLRLGRLEAPGWLLTLVGRPLVQHLLENERVRPAVAALHGLAVESGSLSVTYGRAALPRGFLADLFGGEGASRELAPAVRVYALHLMEGAPALPTGDARFGACVERAFALSQKRSAENPPVAENQAAVVALALLLGHGRIEDLVGTVLDEKQRDRARRSFRGTTLRGRNDWTKHFFVSAGLTALSADRVSDAAGLFKEELDADGGSGFSFGDLLADRAGTRFAQTAARDEASARALQERISRGFQVAHYFPDAAGLPEGIADKELQSRYGGVGGREYRRVVEDLEARLAACPAYRDRGAP